MFKNRLKRRFLSNIGLARSVLATFIISVILALGFGIYYFAQPLTPILFGQNLVSSNGRTNILILGIRGDGSDGQNMTDTMIFASIRHADGQINLITLPRDLWSAVTKTKINAAYSLGFSKTATEGGLLLSKTVVSEISGTPVHYAVVVDFSLFTRFIDALGGVDIAVAKAFTDTKYPILGKENDLCDGDPETLCRYETLKFVQGLQTMDGVRALKFVRSRQSSDLSEGTDFARSARQEQLISAVKSKLLTLPPKKYLEAYRLVKSSWVSDLTPNNYLPMAKILLKSRNKKLNTNALTEDNVLYHPPLSDQYQNQWILLPKGGDPNIIPDFFQQILTN